MEKDNMITIEQLSLAVENYEKQSLKASYENVCSKNPLILRYRSVRRGKLVAFVTEKQFIDQCVLVKRIVLKHLDSDPSLSENVEVFTLAIVPDSLRATVNTMFQEDGLSVTLIDCLQMKSINEFQELFGKNENEESDYDSSLYEYLSMSNDTTDVKNSLFYALIVMMVYQNQPIKRPVLEQLMTDKYGKNVGDVGLALKALRRQNKIAPPGKGDTISLTQEEQTRLERSLKEEKAAENDFKQRYADILGKYGVADGDQILESLREAYQAQYQWHSRVDDDEHRKEDITRQHFKKIKEAVESVLGDQTSDFIQELRRLCDESDYLSRYGLSHSFLQLFRSEGYKKYVTNKESIIFFDTPVVAYYLCRLSGMEDKYGFNWDNSDYQSVKSLVEIKEEGRGKILFAIPYDYLQETVGEIKKALQFSWFDNLDLPIRFETGNTFYKFYLAVRDAQTEKDGKSSTMSLPDFISMIGLEELNPNASLFNKKAYLYLKFFFDKYGCEIIDPIQDRYEQFDNVRDTYSIDLKLWERRKTTMAMNSDIRQAFYIANLHVDDEMNDFDYFLTTWDKTLRELRNVVNNEMSLMSSYSVMNPANLANKLAFRNFQITRKSVSDDVFAYAESGFNFTTKVQTLYDNILTPYFANANNKNSTLVITMLKMEKDCQDKESKDEPRTKDDTTLAEIFLKIVYALPDYDLTPQNLREFLADETNNDFIIPLFEEAFEEYASGNVIDISERFCEKMKEDVMKDDEEIKL